MFTLLIVDDNTLVCQGIKDFIDWDKIGVKPVGICANGLEGYNKAKELKPDLIITDVEMPILNGIEMASRLKDELPEVKFIFISCFEDFHYIKEVMDLHAYKYVLKPIVFEELTDAILKLSEEKQENLIQKDFSNELKEKIKRTMPILQKDFFRELIYCPLIDESSIQSRMNYLGMRDLYNRLYFLMYLEIDDYNLCFMNIQTEQKYIVNEGIKKIFAENILTKKNAIVIGQDFFSLSYIIFPDSVNIQKKMDEIVEELNICTNSINIKLNANVTIGISNYCNQIKEIPQMLQQAQYAVKYKFYSQSNRLIFYSTISTLKDEENYDLQLLKVKLKDILYLDNSMDIDVFLNNYYSEDLNVKQEYIKSLTFSIYTILKIIIIENNTVCISFENDSAIWSKICTFKTLSEIKEWIFNLLETTKLHLRNSKSKHEKIIEDIKNIIDKNYTKINNIEDVVKTLYISASYANSIFKKSTGITIFNYLVNRRIKEAKNLLVDPYVKVYEVSQRVGYKNISYFSSIFREHTGMTPREYTDHNAGMS